MGDLISRQDAIDAVSNMFAITPTQIDIVEDCLELLEYLPSAQSKHDQKAMSKQPDLDTLGIKTGETCEDVISRRDAIDAVEFGITYAKVLNKETGEVMELFKKSNEELQKAVCRIEALPSAQPEIIRCKDCRFWQNQEEGVVEVPICARPENRHEKHPFRFIVGADGYCSFAERITDE